MNYWFVLRRIVQINRKHQLKNTELSVFMWKSDLSDPCNFQNLKMSVISRCKFMFMLFVQRKLKDIHETNLSKGRFCENIVFII